MNRVGTTAPSRQEFHKDMINLIFTLIEVRTLLPPATRKITFTYRSPTTPGEVTLEDFIAFAQKKTWGQDVATDPFNALLGATANESVSKTAAGAGGGKAVESATGENSDSDGEDARCVKYTQVLYEQPFLCKTMFFSMGLCIVFLYSLSFSMWFSVPVGTVVTRALVMASGIQCSRSGEDETLPRMLCVSALYVGHFKPHAGRCDKCVNGGKVSYTLSTPLLPFSFT